MPLPKLIYIYNIYIYYIYIILTEDICSACNPMQDASGSFLQTRINFAEQRLKFSHVEGSIP